VAVPPTESLDDRGVVRLVSAEADVGSVVADPDRQLEALEALAADDNPTLRRMRQETAAAWSRTRYVGRLPDAALGSRFFIPPMNFEPDRQVADVELMQTIPWLARLDAEQKRACMEALALENEYSAERLRVISKVREQWFAFYALQKECEIIAAEREPIELLVNSASDRVATGDAQPNDVLMAALELSSLQEREWTARRQLVATVAELNRLAGRPADTQIKPPQTIAPATTIADPPALFALAVANQPAVQAARLQSLATRWGIEIARLQRRPDLTLGVGWVAMDAVAGAPAGAGRDSFTLGVTTTLPINRRKYGAMLSEATQMHAAAHATEDEVLQQLDATIQSLYEQIESVRRTVRLYEQEILPQARQAFDANQQALATGAASIDRVLRDYRTLLNFQLGYHRSLAKLASGLAQLQQTVGLDGPHSDFESPDEAGPAETLPGIQAD
jgi:cobalt-zinc-cadmium efflux system outer membrane protein